MALIDLITTEVVKVPLTARDKPGVIDELVQVRLPARPGKDDRARTGRHRWSATCTSGLQCTVTGLE